LVTLVIIFFFSTGVWTQGLVLVTFFEYFWISSVDYY
jgi:hypothetical protein